MRTTAAIPRRSSRRDIPIVGRVVLPPPLDEPDVNMVVDE
jgi:hypothetical protein